MAGVLLMQTVTLRPNAVFPGSDADNEWTPIGAADEAAATSDDDVLTRMQFFRLDSWYFTLRPIRLEFTDLAVDRPIFSVGLRTTNFSGPASQSQVLICYLYPDRNRPSNGGVFISGVNMTNAIQTHTAYVFEVDENGVLIVQDRWFKTAEGDAFTAEDIDRCFLEVYAGGVAPPSVGASIQISVYEIYLDVTYNEAPSVVVTEPADPETTNALPYVTFAYSDPESDRQDYFWVKVFNDTQYTAGGFDPETSDAYWNSGEIHSAFDLQNYVRVQRPLDDDTYRAYVKAADFGGYSAWAFKEFTVATVKPPVPTFSCTAEPDQARIRLGFSVGAGPPAASEFWIERSLDLLTFEHVGILANLAPNVTYDYTAPRGQTVYYRARSVTHTEGEYSDEYSTTYLDDFKTVLSNYSLIDSCFLSNDGQDWLKSLDNSNLNMPICLAPASSESDEPQAHYAGLTRADPVIMARPVRKERLNLELIFTDDDQYARFEQMRTHTLLLQRCHSDNPQYFIKSSSARETTRLRIATGSTNHRRVRVSAVSVADVFAL